MGAGQERDTNNGDRSCSNGGLDGEGIESLRDTVNDSRFQSSAERYWESRELQEKAAEKMRIANERAQADAALPDPSPPPPSRSWLRFEF
jgi:hypothetical protein